MGHSSVRTWANVGVARARQRAERRKAVTHTFAKVEEGERWWELGGGGGAKSVWCIGGCTSGASD